MQRRKSIIIDMKHGCSIWLAEFERTSKPFRHAKRDDLVETAKSG